MFDWLQAWPGLLSPADKAAVRAVFMKWCEDNLPGVCVCVCARVCVCVCVWGWASCCR